MFDLSDIRDKSLAKIIFTHRSNLDDILREYNIFTEHIDYVLKDI